MGSIPNMEKRMDIGGQFTVSQGNKLRQIDPCLSHQAGQFLLVEGVLKSHHCLQPLSVHMLHEHTVGQQK